MSEALKNIIILTCIVLFGVLGWYMYDQNRQLQLRTTTTSGVALQAETQQFIQKQNELKRLSMSTELFENPNFLEHQLGGF